MTDPLLDRITPDPCELCACGHSQLAHDGHTVAKGSPAVYFCSQNDGCKHFTPKEPL